MLSHLLFTDTERYWWEIQFKCYVGKSWNDRIKKEEMAKIAIMLSFDTSRYHQQVFKEIWTDWNVKVNLNRWREVMYIFLIMKNTYLPQFSNKLDENLKFIFIWPNTHFFSFTKHTRYFYITIIFNLNLHKMIIVWIDYVDFDTKPKTAQWHCRHARQSMIKSLTCGSPHHRLSWTTVYSWKKTTTLKRPSRLAL